MGRAYPETNWLPHQFPGPRPLAPATEQGEIKPEPDRARIELAQHLRVAFELGAVAVLSQAVPSGIPAKAMLACAEITGSQDGFREMHSLMQRRGEGIGIAARAPLLQDGGVPG